MIDLLPAMLAAVEQAYHGCKFRRLDVDDAKQEGYLACLRASAKLDPERGDPISYFRYAARWGMTQANVAAGRKKRNMVLPEVFDPADTTEEKDDSLEQQIVLALARLKPSWRGVIIKRYWLEQTQREVAADLGCTHQNVCAMEKQALRRLSEMLA